MDKQLLERIKQSEASLVLLQQGLDALKQSGVIELLKSTAVVAVKPGSTVTTFAFEAAEIAGFNRAITELLNFKELFIVPRSPQSMPPQSYGGMDAALKKGDLLPSDITALEQQKIS